MRLHALNRQAKGIKMNKDRLRFRVYVKYSSLLEEIDSFYIDNAKEKITIHFPVVINQTF